MRFDTNLYEERQRWIHYIQLNEQGIPHPTNPGLTWHGGVDGAWMTKSGSYYPYPEPKPTFTAQQHIDYANRRVEIGNAARAKLAPQVAKVAQPSWWVRAGQFLARNAGKLRSGAMMPTPGEFFDIMDANPLFGNTIQSGGISDEDQAIQDGIEAGTHDASGYQFRESKNHSCLREQFYGF